MDKAKMKKALKDFWYGKPHGERRLGDILEDKTGLVRRFLQMQQHVDRIITAAGDIKTINYRQYENPRLEELAETILDAAAALKE